MHYPGRVADLRAWFPDDAACLDYLDWLRWPGGFVCPHCASGVAWRLRDGRYSCGGCKRRVSVTAGTIFHGTRTPLTVWFEAATSVNSALARARKIVADKVPDHTQQQTLSQIDDARLREIVAGYSAALQCGDVDALVALLTEDVTWSMPPLPSWYHGLEAVSDFATQLPLAGHISCRHLPTSANGQPAVGCYLRTSDTGAHLAWSIDVLTLRGGRIDEITSFIGPHHFTSFALPASLT